jgi:hypothetical protein
VLQSRRHPPRLAKVVVGAARNAMKKGFPMATRKNGRSPAVLRPGQTILSSGIYKDPKSGEKTTLVHGKTAPPTPKAGGWWHEIVETHPK